MTDNILSAVLTFSLLVAGTVAIGAEMFNDRQSTPVAPARVVVMPAVMVVGQRIRTEIVVLPTVTVTGHRAPVQLAYEPQASQPHQAE